MCEKMAAKLQKIEDKAQAKKLKLFKKVVEKQKDKLFEQLDGFITNTLCDPIYQNYLDRDAIEVTERFIAYDVLEDCIADTDIMETHSIAVMARTLIAGKSIDFQVWSMIDYDMSIYEGDMQVMSENNDIDCNFNNGCIAKSVLELIHNELAE